MLWVWNIGNKIDRKFTLAECVKVLSAYFRFISSIWIIIIDIEEIKQKYADNSLTHSVWVRVLLLRMTKFDRIQRIYSLIYKF